MSACRAIAAMRASALLLVLWALFLLSAAVFAYAKWIQADIQLHGLANREIEARAMAHSGLAWALHPLVTEKTEGIDEDLAADLGFKVHLESEGKKLNINWLIQGEDPVKLGILKRWLELRGLDLKQRDTFVDCLLDWVDGDDQARLNGQEADGDYQPPNRGLQEIEEIEEIANSAPLTRSLGWKDQLTLFSQGPIDMTAADADMLRLIGFGDGQILRFLAIRRGRDGVDGTDDDYKFKNLKEVQSFLGLNDATFKQLGGLIILKDSTTRIISEGRSADVTRQVQVVARKGGSNPQILLWKE